MPAPCVRIDQQGGGIRSVLSGMLRVPAASSPAGRMVQTRRATAARTAEDYPGFMLVDEGQG